ncbi:MAG: hypothetical protein ABIK09_17485 [Pseudomonadota bacterium]
MPVAKFLTDLTNVSVEGSYCLCPDTDPRYPNSPLHCVPMRPERRIKRAYIKKIHKTGQGLEVDINPRCVTDGANPIVHQITTIVAAIPADRDGCEDSIIIPHYIIRTKQFSYLYILIHPVSLDAGLFLQRAVCRYYEIDPNVSPYWRAPIPLEVIDPPVEMDKDPIVDFQILERYDAQDLLRKLPRAAMRRELEDND